MAVIGCHPQAVKAITRLLGGASDKNRGDLLAAPPGNEIAGAQAGADQQGDLAENVIAFGVFEEIVDAMRLKWSMSSIVIVIGRASRRA